MLLIGNTGLADAYYRHYRSKKKRYLHCESLFYPTTMAILCIDLRTSLVVFTLLVSEVADR